MPKVVLAVLGITYKSGRKVFQVKAMLVAKHKEQMLTTFPFIQVSSSYTNLASITAQRLRATDELPARYAHMHIDNLIQQGAWNECSLCSHSY